VNEKFVLFFLGLFLLLLICRTKLAFAPSCFHFIFDLFFPLCSFFFNEQMSSVEELLYDAAWGGHASEVLSLLRVHPEVNINWGNEEEWTPLHVASSRDHDEVVKVLLAHPNIDVNLKDKDGQTPLSLSCEYGLVAIVRLLVKDSRVTV